MVLEAISQYDSVGIRNHNIEALDLMKVEHYHHHPLLVSPVLKQSMRMANKAVKVFNLSLKYGIAVYVTFAFPSW